MEKTILGYLRGKTIIMPTHAVKYLEQSDNIIIMEKGKIIANGPFKHVSDSN
jgi:ABC-type transport system involved in cytochrome bd biosynthesis fused ATPase/permease subunit